MTQAAIIPVRMQNFFKDIQDSGVVKDVCDIFKLMPAGNISPLHLVNIEVLSTIICPVYGDFYSFPWKRGPHDSILEYIEAQKIFEKLRDTVFNNLKDFDFIAKSLALFVKEDESKYVEVKCSVLRLFI